MQRDDDRFSDRKKSQEAKYKMDEERRFKVRARRNKLLGLWIAGRTGLDGDLATAVGRDAVSAGMDARSDEEFIQILIAKFPDSAGRIGGTELSAELRRCEAEAMRQISEEFPSALDGDHAPVGDPPHHRR